MKLSDLRGSIRKASGNPSMVVDLGNGVPLTITFQKTPLLEELGRVFNGERTAETGLTFDSETGTILVEGRLEPLSGNPHSDFAANEEDDELDTIADPRAEGPFVQVDLDDEDDLL